MLLPFSWSWLWGLVGFFEDSPVQSQGSDSMDVCGVLMSFKTQPDLPVLKVGSAPDSTDSLSLMKRHSF